MTSWPVKEGFLQKRKHALSWKSLRCVLNRGVLVLFRVKANSFPLTTISLQGCNIGSVQGTVFEITLFTGQRVSFRATTSTEAEDWVNVLNLTCRSHYQGNAQPQIETQSDGEDGAAGEEEDEWADPFPPVATSDKYPPEPADLPVTFPTAPQIYYDSVNALLLASRPQLENRAAERDVSELIALGDAHQHYAVLGEELAGDHRVLNGNLALNSRFFRGVHVRAGNEVLIKIFPRFTPDSVRQLVNEVQLSQPGHPNLFRLYECFHHEPEGSLWLVYERTQYIQLCEFTDDQHPINEGQIAFICREILYALTYFHSRGIAIRTLSPDLVCVLADGSVRLPPNAGTPPDPRGSGEIGAPYWLAPEVIRGRELGTPADIWSLGTIARELAEGEPPLIQFPPLRAAFVVVTQGLPPFQNPEAWSDHFRDFVEITGKLEPSERPSALDLLTHPFILRAAGQESIAPVIRALLSKSQS